MPHTLEDLAGAVRALWREGWPVGEEVLAFAASTYGSRDAADFRSLLQDADQHGTEPLWELVFYPDEAAQIRLEPILENGAFTKADEEKLIVLLEGGKNTAWLRLPSGLTFEAPVARSCIRPLVSRLRIARAVPPNVSAAITERMPPTHAVRARVKLRNARFSYAENRVRFLEQLFHGLPSQDPDFWPCLDLMLTLMEGWNETTNPFDALMAGKRFLFQSLQRYRNARARFQKHNMETLAQQRIPVPSLNPEEIRLQLRLIDRVAMAIFQTTEYLPDSGEAVAGTWTIRS